MTLRLDKIPVEKHGRTRQSLWKCRMDFEATIPKYKIKTDPSEELPQGPKVIVANVLLRALGILRNGLDNALRPVLHEYSLKFPGLPHAFDGYRILHLSDFHFRNRLGFIDVVRRLIDGIDHDLCVMTGDFLYCNGAPKFPVTNALRQIIPRIKAKDGILAVLGNNDTGEFVADFKPLGINMLVNENQSISRGRDSIWIAGVDDPHDYRCDSLRAALDGIPAGAFTILLAHSPEIARSAARCGVDLYLCGHTHGGQIRFPRVGPIYRNSRAPYRMTQSHWRVGEMQGYTTTGLGTSTLPVRYNCIPEAVLFTLTKSNI